MKPILLSALLLGLAGCSNQAWIDQSTCCESKLGGDVSVISSLMVGTVVDFTIEDQIWETHIKISDVEKTKAAHMAKLAEKLEAGKKWCEDQK